MTYLKYYFTYIQKLINRIAYIRNIGRFCRYWCSCIDNQIVSNVTLPLPCRYHVLP